jgi:hypothetical protein
MSDFNFTGPLQGLKAVEISDLQRYKTAITNGSQMGFDYYFPSLLASIRPGRSAMLIEDVNDSICVFRWKHTDDKPRLDIFLGPAPMDINALKLCIERANDYNGDYSARLMNIDAKDYDVLAEHDFFSFKERNSQYLYAPEYYTDIAGDAFSILRKNVEKIRALDNLQVLPYTLEHREACFELLRKWRSHSRSTYGTNGATGNTRRLLDLASSFATPELLGEVIFLNEELVAFSIGGEIRPGYAAYLEAKCDPTIPELSYFQRYSFILRLSPFQLVNNGADNARHQDLEQLKNSLQPIDLHTEYRGIQRKHQKTVTSGKQVNQGTSTSSKLTDPLTLSGALTGLKVLETSDLDRYQRALVEGAQMGWAYYFPYLLTRNRPGRYFTLILEDEGSICIFLWQLIDNKPRVDLLTAPTPMNKSVLKRCIERANEFNLDHSARIMRIDSKDSEAVADIGINIRERKQQYIFSPGNYNQLSGKKYYTLRRNVTLIERLPDVEVVPYTQTHAQDCHKLLKNWGKLHRAKHGTVGGVGISRRIIDLAGTLPSSILRGEVIYVKGKLAAFTFGGQIRPGLACSFERKCDTEVRGLSYFQLRSFLCSFDDETLVNDGSDAGSAGLRQLKDSFRPIYTHSEFRGIQQKAKP